MKKNIGIVFGGKSVEHEVSIITGLQVFENINKNKYKVSLIYIDKDGRWFSQDKLSKIEIYKNWDKNKKKIKEFFPSLNKKDKKNKLALLDAAVIACHGNYGEDGKIQGLFELLDIPYTSCGVLGSSAGMDKIVMKKIFSGMDLSILPYLWFYRDEWKVNQKDIINKIHYTLDYPIFIKPANLGSSIGISMVNNESELIKAIDVAVEYDRRILVEKGITNAVEVNCSCIFNDQKVEVSALEEPVHWEKFLSFDDKYIRNNSKSKSGKSGMSGMARKIPADISEELKNEIENYSLRIYKVIDCKGIVRIDFILDEDRKKLYVNEINTIPGSLSFYLWEPKGISFSSLIDILIENAILFNEDKKRNITRYDSEILNKITKGSKF